MNDNISRQKLIEALNKSKEEWEHFSNDYEMGVWDGLLLAIGAVSALESQLPADQWIPCSERLPGVADEYEVTVDCDGKLFTTNSFYSVCESEWSTWVNHITAWRERLPEPYKEVE